MNANTVGESLEPRTLLHFDIRAADEATRRRVDRFLYGYRQVKRVSGERKVYRYAGLLERCGGRHYGQSVVVLPTEAAEAAFYFLRGMRVPCQRIDILAPSWV